MTRIRVPLAATLLALAAGVALGAPLTAAGGHNTCPTSNPPNMLAIVGGSTQTAQFGKAFQVSLQVTLANSNGCPLTGSLAGISVDFIAPASGASGTFASSGSNVAVVGTDAAGVAVAPLLTANSTAGAYSVRAESDYGSVDLNLTNTAHGVASTVAATGPTEQSATVLGRYAQPLEATVLDADGHPVQGASVTFSLGSGTFGAGASFLGGGAQATELTDASGQATSPPFVANNVAGSFTALASAAGISEPVGYSLHNVAAKTTISATTRATQTATVATSYRRPLQARVLDGEGRPVEGASVSFAIGSSASGAGASFVGGGSQATELTGASGVATSPPLRAGAIAGRFAATATTVGATEPVSFSLRNLAGRPAAIAAGVAASESTPVASRFPIRLAVTVTDANGNPVGGALVTFTAPASGAGGHFRRGTRTARVATSSSGVAVAPTFTANNVPGGYVVIARAGGSKRSAAFALVNERR
jgi:protocatechuate 3,4-dioxygenase beta subunit